MKSVFVKIKKMTTYYFCGKLITESKTQFIHGVHISGCFKRHVWGEFQYKTFCQQFFLKKKKTLQDSCCECKFTVFSHCATLHHFSVWWLQLEPQEVSRCKIRWCSGTIRTNCWIKVLSVHMFSCGFSYLVHAAWDKHTGVILDCMVYRHCRPVLCFCAKINRIFLWVEFDSLLVCEITSTTDIYTKAKLSFHTSWN